MVQTDWERILSVNAASLTDEEMEDLFPTVIQCEVDEIDDVRNLRTLVKLSQEMLQYKDNQVESLLLECGELKETISSLRPEASKRKKKDQTKPDVKHEDSKSAEGFAPGGTVQEKNEKIGILMAELEDLEKENALLKSRLTSLTQEMEDATEKMNEMTEELSSVQRRSAEYKERIAELERENLALVGQIEELTAQQIDRDKVIDEFGSAIDARITEWKGILDEKDAEIVRLKEELSHSLMQSVTSIKEQNKSQIVYLNEEIDRRDKVIAELQKKLAEAVVEINESATLIEKLKADAEKTTGRTERRKEHRDLLKKLQEANEKISNLQKSLVEAEENEKSQSRKLCEALITLRKYQDENHGLSEALGEIKELKDELCRKKEHIEDLVNIVNKLEMLNSYQEMEIITLREKLGIPKDESVSIQSTMAKHKEVAKKMEELVRQNKALTEENLELKSDIRTLRYKLHGASKQSDLTDNRMESSLEFMHSTKLPEQDLPSSQTLVCFKETNIGEGLKELKENIQLVIEENEALRRGMHEILDSIRNQDGKSAVEIQSSTLERLLEALDSRHLAGWYHPAMRLQEHLNVVQGSNAELRNQIKLMRKELQRKDNVLQELAGKRDTDVSKLLAEEADDEEISTYLSEMTNLQFAYRNEAEEWEKQKESLIRQNDELHETVDRLKGQLEIYEKNWTVFEEGEDEIKKALAVKTKEYIAATSEILVANKKNTVLQQLLNKESTKLYQYQKEAIEREASLKRSLADASKRNKTLEYEITTLQSNLTNSISILEYNELKEKHEELNIRFRIALENSMTVENLKEIELVKAELELIKREKQELTQQLEKESADLGVNENNVNERLREIKAKELVERQRADHMTKLHEISQSQLAKCEENVKEVEARNLELQEKLIEMHKQLTKELNVQSSSETSENKLKLLEDSNATLKTENEALKKALQISQEEAQLQYSLNSLQTLELDNLRHQILDLQAASEDKAIISRLDFELNNKKALEIELNARKMQLESEVSHLQEELENSRSRCDEAKAQMQDCRKQCEIRCKYYLDIISFLQRQYAGSTSLTSLERVAKLSAKLQSDRQEIESEMRKARESHENAKFQQELLMNRLQIIERLKDILERQIGSSSVEEMMQRFSEESQHSLSDFKYKRRIAHLEYELQIAEKKFAEYESLILNFEDDLINMQKAWSQQRDPQPRKDMRVSEAKSIPDTETRCASVQITTETFSVETQTDPYTCCLDQRDRKTEEKDVESSIEKHPVKDGASADKDVQYEVEKTEKKNDRSEEGQQSSAGENTHLKKSVVEAGNNTDNNSSVAFLKEQLAQALTLASERSAMLIKYETQITEYQTKVDVLNKAVEEKDSQLAQKEKALEECKVQPPPAAVDGSDKLALKSTINSLQKLISQKEETIARYQNLLKEDRDEHSRAASRLQEEIKELHDRIFAMQNEMKKIQEKSRESDKFAKTEEITATAKVDSKNSVVQEEEMARLREKVSTLEADLDITKELSERWHRLAEERLKHMDRMRERLEEQHKTELESYRMELTKWQSEADLLRQQLSENRMVLTKGNISLMKDLQERDDKIQELSLACQQLQNEVEILESTNWPDQVIVQTECNGNVRESTHVSSRDQLPQQNQMDVVRRQLQSFIEKEKMYKREIAELKQRLSHRYMAVKSQEKKASQREMQLEKKVKALEEELEKAQAQLNREYLAQEAKKAKTAEELALWEKQKKWQQTAEKLKQKLKEKTDEYTKLLSNYEKLRSVVSCMEREKWYLKSKLKVENENVAAGNLSARPVSTVQQNTLELQKECQTLRDRVKELTDRLEKEDTEELVRKIEEQKRHIAALEAVTEGNTYVISQLEKLEMAKDVLEKTNLKLESENFELRLEIEKANADTPRLREKVEHLEKYIELLKAEKSSDSTPRSDKELQDQGLKKSTLEMEKTIFTLKRIIERLQTENKRLKTNAQRNHVLPSRGTTLFTENDAADILQRQYEQAQKRVIALETDLQLAEQRISMLEQTQIEDGNGDSVKVLRQQLIQKSELLDRVKHLLTRAAINEKALRQRVKQLESKQALSTIPECYVTSPSQ